MRYSTMLRSCRSIFFSSCLVLTLGVLSACASSKTETPSTPHYTAVTPASPLTATTTPVAHEQKKSVSFNAWLADFSRDAAAQGISTRALSALDNVRYIERIIELDRHQPEFVRPIWDYLDGAVSRTRIANGQAKLAEHRQTAMQMQQRFGVPAEVIVAIWGIESDYGRNFGSFSALSAFATLAYEGRRSEFARTELLAALRIIDSGEIAAEEMIGSWAGAMGHTQFIPSSFESFAKDGDGDGRRDIWGSIPDVMASTANYLAQAGWEANQPWGVEVVLPANFDFTQTDRRSSAEWANQGIKAINGTLPNFASASVIVPAGVQGPAFLVGPNFNAILRYNNATSYALAVATLSDAIMDRPGVQQSWPRDQVPLTRVQVRELQEALNARGYSVGTADGIMGPNTRNGLRAFQHDQGLIPDGFATQSLLQRIKGH